MLAGLADSDESVGDAYDNAPRTQHLHYQAVGTQSPRDESLLLPGVWVSLTVWIGG
jgi:hypothetical protein